MTSDRQHADARPAVSAGDASPAPEAVLLVNLGSPDSPSVPDVRRYLREFLMDGRVLDAPWPVRFMIVHGFILPFRPRRSAEAYHQIWTPAGSPLVETGRQLRGLLETRAGLPVELAMRYGHPTIEEALRRLAGRGVRDVFLIPLFPHYAMSSYETAVERVRELLPSCAPGARLHVQGPYYDHPGFIDALVAQARPRLSQPYDHVLFSFHGLPERHLRKSDPTGCHCLARPDCCQTPSPAHATCYRRQCLETVRAFIKAAGVPEARCSTSFQSRLGRDPWLKPPTTDELRRLPGAGVKSLVVLCPAFTADCLETLEEIGLRGRETFLGAGGREFTMVPCVNVHPLWVDALAEMVHTLRSQTAPVCAPNPEAA